MIGDWAKASGKMTLNPSKSYAEKAGFVSEAQVAALVVPLPRSWESSSSLSAFGKHLFSELQALANMLWNLNIDILGVPTGKAKLFSLLRKEPPETLFTKKFKGSIFVMNLSCYFLSEPVWWDASRRSSSSEMPIFIGSREKGELYAAFFKPSNLSKKELRNILAHLTQCQDTKFRPAWREVKGARLWAVQKAGEHCSPALLGVVGTRGRSSPIAPKYLNAAVLDILQRPTGSRFERFEPDQLLKVFLALMRDSSVPWIFNMLANEVEYRGGRSNMASFPPEAHISLTGRCNIECRFCSYTHENALDDYVTLSQVKRLDFFKYVHTVGLSSGLGESTLNPDFPAIIDYLARTYRHLRMILFTNGVALGRDRLIHSLLGQVTWINVSLNAATRKTWQELTGVDAFERVCSNLRKLHAAKKTKKLIHPLVFGSMVLTRTNVNELPLMPEVCRAHGIDRFVAIPFFSLNFDHARKFGEAETLERCRDQYDQQFEEVVENAKRHKVSVELPLPLSDKRDKFGLEARRFFDFAGIGQEDPLSIGLIARRLLGVSPENALCHWLWRIALIGKTGRGHVSAPAHYLYPCLGPLGLVDFSKQTEFNFPQAGDFLRLWNNPHFAFLRAAQTQRGTCRLCDLCKSTDTRDPALSEQLQKMVREWASFPGVRTEADPFRQPHGK